MSADTQMVCTTDVNASIYTRRIYNIHQFMCQARKSLHLPTYIHTPTYIQHASMYLCAKHDVSMCPFVMLTRLTASNRLYQRNARRDKAGNARRGKAITKSESLSESITSALTGALIGPSTAAKAQAHHLWTKGPGASSTSMGQSGSEGACGTGCTISAPAGKSCSGSACGSGHVSSGGGKKSARWSAWGRAGSGSAAAAASS